MRCQILNPRQGVVIGAVLASIAFTGCQSGGISMEDTSVNEVEELDAEAPVDEATQEQIDMGERMDFWVDQMDPYMTTADDWSYQFDRDAFLMDMSGEHPDVALCLSDSSSELTQDCALVTGLIDGLPIVNELIAEDYAEYQETGVMMVGAWTRYNWWGVSLCYSGSDAHYMAYLMKIGAASKYVPGIGWVAGFVFAAYGTTAGYLASACGGFCLNITWANHIWVTCP